MRAILINVALLVICISVCLLIAEAQQDVSTQIVPSARSRFVLPKIFDFARFKQLFKKRYSSMVQEVARQKIFLAKAFAAFISAVNYKFRKSDHHLGINKLSDQTPNEFRMRLNRIHSKKFEDDSTKLAIGNKTNIMVADQQEIEQELESILENRNNDVGIELAKEEISRSLESRKKREINPRDLSLNDLMNSKTDIEMNKKIVRTIPSNNPNYEPIELMSFGTEDETGGNEPELPESEANFITSLPGASFLKSMKNKLMSEFGGNEDSKSKRKFDTNEESDEVYIDWRDSKCFFEPRDQGDCGSCYIFSTISLLEWAHCVKTGKLVAFSEQYMIDCGFRFGLKGCQGGYEKEVINFASKYGLELRTNYPYRGTEGTCPYTRETDPTSMGYVRMEKKRLKLVNIRKLEKTLKQTPVLVTIDTPDDFSDYGGGVHAGDKCGEDGEHAMLLIGSGRQDGNEYWLMRNSFDTSWGEKGYYKLNKNSPCFVQKESMTFADNIDDLYKPNSKYQAFRLSRRHEARDPDAPKDIGPIAGPVHAS